MGDDRWCARADPFQQHRSAEEPSTELALTIQTSAKPSLSVLMLTYNEELNLEPSLSGVGGWADDVVILDSFSTDRTVEIARKYGARVYQNEFEGHARQWTWGLDNI